MTAPVTTTYRELFATVRLVTLPVPGPDGETDWLFQIVNEAGELGIPVTAGPQGDRGPAGGSIRVLGEKASTAQLPALADTTEDRGKGYWIGPVLWSWSGAGWQPSPNLTGPRGSAASIDSAADYEAAVAAVEGDLMRRNSAGKWAPFRGPGIEMEHVPVAPGSFVVPNDNTTLTAVPLHSRIRLAGASGSAPVWSTDFPSRVVAKLPGLYRVQGRVTWPTDGGGSRSCGIRRNGTTLTSPAAGGTDLWLGDGCQAANSFTSVAVDAEVQLAANEWVELMAGCTRAGGFAPAAGRHDTWLRVTYKHP